MASGIFRLYCKPSDSQPWGLLESFAYDDAAKRKRDQREGALSRALLAATRWYYNYAQFRSALFCCEEQPDQWSPLVHVFGTKRPKKKHQPGGLQRRPYTPTKKKAVRKSRPKKVAKKAKKGKRK